MPLSPETAASIFPLDVGTIAAFDTDTEGFPSELAGSKIRVWEPLFVVRRIVKR